MHQLHTGSFQISRLIIRGLAATALFATATTFALAQSVPVVTGDARVDKLLSQMTLEEKLTLIHGTKEDPSVYQGQAGYLAGIPRLHIPGLRFADGPPGVLTRHPSQGETATMGVAATFSIKDAEDNGLVIGREARALGIDVALQPFVNIDRDLEFGRGYNTFGEDPFLTSEMAVGEVKGIQSQHVMAQIKHYVGYDSDAGSTFIDDQTLHEVYVAPFDAAIRRADVSSIMCSYNRLNGTFACGNKDSLTTILRDQIGFKGFVTSDWGAVHAVSFINAGLDMEMPGGQPGPMGSMIPSFFDSLQPPPPPPHRDAKETAELNESMFGGHIPEEPAPVRGLGGDFGVKLDPKKMPEALKDGSVTEATVTRAAGRVLYEIVHFGYLDGKSKHDFTTQSIEANAKIIEKTGEDAAVLLKNEGSVLPLKHDELDSVVLIGPTASQVDSIGINGERSVGLPDRQIGPLDAMKRISGNSDIGFAVDDDMTGTTIPATAFSHEGKPGLQRAIVSTSGTSASAATQTDPQLDFTVKGGNPLPPNSVVMWKGTLTPPHAGTYWIYLQAMGTNARISLDGKRLASTGAFQGGVHGDILQANQDNAIPTTDRLDNVRRAIELTAGPHAIEVTTSPDSSNQPVQVRLNWYTPEQRKADHEHAIAAAKNAKVAVVFLWTRLEPVFGLPGEQNKLVEEIAAVNPNTVVVLNTSQPVALPWVDKVKAVLEMWWPGDEGGWSTANILLGKTSPAGRLPVTWGKSLTDYPATDPKHPERSKKGVDHKTTYSEGVNVGYRWFDKENIEPLFAFGHGLSYTAFEYSALNVVKSSDGGINIKVSIKNTGSAASDEVPQVYLSAPGEVPEGVQFPVRSLVAFDRIHLSAGESKTVSFQVAPRQLQYWSTKDQKWATPTGKRTVSVGASSRDLRLNQTID
ncbi:glycoside hydrolase family 3 C-terminal domain-containing protein [Telmatobacter sp. DSM 110680]|uniref:Glycoside hydrolase family 3 C-terminal domain-containing protein n=1 Tax=Telmatobacter sp. DSM 110680 TaxID=3036704 RepID=A0AAU7DDZ2_9BACT